MKKIFFVFVLQFITSVSLVLMLNSPVQASVNDFEIVDFKADYYLSVDNEGRSILKTIEKIQAKFPSYDQNHGIERAIPREYDDHNTKVSVESVTDSDGVLLNYSVTSKNGNDVIRVGDSDKYVHGLRNYTITYNQRDVTKYFSDTDDDEFYWNVNGLFWKQGMDKVSATIHIDPSLVDKLNNKMSCYFGTSNSSKPCSIKRIGDEILAEVVGVGANQTMTVAIGFKAGTFAAYQMTDEEKLIKIVLMYYFALSIIVFILSIGLVFYVLWLRSRYAVEAKVQNAITPEYVPPKGVDLITCAVILKNNQKWVAATYVDLAVKGKVKIIESKVGFSKKNVYAIELISTDDLSSRDLEIIKLLFNAEPTPGDRRVFDKSVPDFELYKSLKRVYLECDAQAVALGYFENTDVFKKKTRKIILALSIMMIFMFASFISLVIVFCIYTLTKPLSLKGCELKSYLEGLRMYIKIAEEDRIKRLQSPKGAEKTPSDVNNKEYILSLYERLLPYAILLGCEKEWCKTLGGYYEKNSSNPSWYSGSDGFNAVMFGSMVSSFSSDAIANSYPTSSGSSSGGSGGGGFAGGGGGGGGGGGW